jgi:hypothetical protein
MVGPIKRVNFTNLKIRKYTTLSKLRTTTMTKSKDSDP